MPNQTGTTIVGSLKSFVTVVTALEKALATVVEEIGVKNAIAAITNKDDVITQMIRLMLTALINNQCLVLETPAVKTSLLRLLHTYTSSKVEEFTVKDHYREGTVQGVQIAFVTEEFKKLFYDKIEKHLSAALMCSHELLLDSLDPAIITDLGQNFKSTLAYLWDMLRLQSTGNKSVLLTNDNTKANILYIEDDAGTLWAVHVNWTRDGWVFGVRSVGDLIKWSAGGQVLGCLLLQLAPTDN